MNFGEVATRDALGCVLAHSTRIAERTLKKGRRLTPEDIEALIAAGYEHIVAACLSEDDVPEDTAAERIAEAARGAGLYVDAAFTGRVNLYAETNGLLVIDKSAVDRMNRLDPTVTIATLPEFEKVTAGRMVATAKIIPFAVPEHLVGRAEAEIRGALSIAPFTPRKIGLVATKLPHLKTATMDKTRRVLEQRLQASGSTILEERRVVHSEEAVAEAMTALRAAGADLLILFGASAVVDRQDVLPSSIERAGGNVVYFGMPVDPGNLLLLGDLAGVPVLGAPGCARSPKENGFDWILDRLLAGLSVTGHDISGFGVGGLLMEIGSRPQPREKPPVSPRAKISAIVLGAGRSSRMGSSNKLLAEVDGLPLIAHALKAACGSEVSETVLVTGHMADEVCRAAADYTVRVAHNPDFAEGMATSIRTGLNALSPDADAVLILLGDMPGITSGTLDTMIAAYRSRPEIAIVAASADGKRGNPVLWDRSFFTALGQLEGDTGARHIIAANRHRLCEIEIGAGARVDLDTPDALEAYRRKSQT